MAKKEEYLEREARIIGYQKMLNDITELLETDLSVPQKIALTDQQNKIEALLEAI
jgi:hypothetical protein